jgi:plasmid stabilization system protein ParE
MAASGRTEGGAQLFEAACDLERVAIIFNPASGTQDTGRRRAALEALARAAGLHCELGETDREQGAAPLARQALADGVERLLATPEIPVERMTKKGLRTFDCRAAVVSMHSEPHERGSRIDVVVRHGVPSVRPDDVLHGMAAVGALTPGEGVLLTRVAQGPLEDDGTVGDPLA